MSKYAKVVNYFIAFARRFNSNDVVYSYETYFDQERIKKWHQDTIC